MVDPAVLARSEAYRIGEVCRGLARAHERLNGGMLVASEPGTWCNFACGVGLDRPFTPDELERLEGFFVERGVQPRVETSPYIHAGALAQLAERGFAVRRFESVLCREIRAGEAVQPLQATEGLRVACLERGDEAGLERWAAVHCAGFLPGLQVPAEELSLAKRTIDWEKSWGFVAMVGDRVVGAAGCDISHTPFGISASLFGAATDAEFRRLGVQQALIAARLNFAAERGARVAVIGGEPGAGTERNVRRMGFGVAYTAVALVKPVAGTVANRDLV